MRIPRLTLEREQYGHLGDSTSAVKRLLIPDLMRSRSTESRQSKMVQSWAKHSYHRCFVVSHSSGTLYLTTTYSQVYLYVDLESSTFHLAQQNLDAHTPLPKSSASCPAHGTLSNTGKGLIALGAVLASIILGAASYAVYRWLNKKPPDSTAPVDPNPRLPW